MAPPGTRPRSSGNDVLNVAEHRLGTSEIESALVSHAGVAEAAVVGRPDEMKGQAVVAFVTLKEKEKATPKLREKLRQHVAVAIGAIALFLRWAIRSH